MPVGGVIAFPFPVGLSASHSPRTREAGSSTHRETPGLGCGVAKLVASVQGPGESHHLVNHSWKQDKESECALTGDTKVSRPAGRRLRAGAPPDLLEVRSSSLSGAGRLKVIIGRPLYNPTNDKHL